MKQWTPKCDRPTWLRTSRTGTRSRWPGGGAHAGFLLIGEGVSTWYTKFIDHFILMRTSPLTRHGQRPWRCEWNEINQILPKQARCSLFVIEEPTSDLHGRCQKNNADNSDPLFFFRLLSKWVDYDMDNPRLLGKFFILLRSTVHEIVMKINEKLCDLTWQS